MDFLAPKRISVSESLTNSTETDGSFFPRLQFGAHVSAQPLADQRVCLLVAASAEHTC